MNNSKRINLIAQGVRKSPTGYIATCDEETQNYQIEVSPEEIGYDYYQSIIGDDIWLSRTFDSSPAVSNMACMLLTGIDVYDSVQFLKYDREKQILRFPTIEELKPVMNMLCIRYTEDDYSGVEFADMDGEVDDND